jgi:hypothetical protein
LLRPMDKIVRAAVHLSFCLKPCTHLFELTQDKLHLRAVLYGVEWFAAFEDESANQLSRRRIREKNLVRGSPGVVPERPGLDVSKDPGLLVGQVGRNVQFPGRHVCRQRSTRSGRPRPLNGNEPGE